LTVALAHHSPAAFDRATEVFVEGTVTELAWRNPHVYLTVQTVGDDGRTVLQKVEGGALSVVQTYGLTRELVAPGAHVVVRANPSRLSEGIVRGLDVAVTNGVVYALNPEGESSSPPLVATPAEGLAGNWVPSNASFTGLLVASESWPLTEAARARATDSSAAVVSSGICQAFPPPILTSLPNLRTIEVGRDVVVIRYDADGLEAVRIIRLDQSEHPADAEPTLLGHSIGRWEGETLVVDTVAFAPNPSGLTVGAPSGPGKHMVERLSLTNDRLRLKHEFTLEDPAHLAEPVSFAALWDHRPDLKPSGEACDPEVARRFLDER
jgi:hypothetical protein